MTEQKEVTLEKFKSDMQLIRNGKRTDLILNYWAKEGEEDWNFASFNIGYSEVDENKEVEFDGDIIGLEGLPKQYEAGEKVLCYSYNRNYSENEGSFVVNLIEEWSDEEIYEEMYEQAILSEEENTKNTKLTVDAAAKTAGWMRICS